MCARTLAASVSFLLFPVHLTHRIESLCTSTLLSPITLDSTRASTECVSEGETDSGRKAGLMLVRCTTPSEYPRAWSCRCPSQGVCQSVSSHATKVVCTLPFLCFLCFCLFVLVCLFEIGSHSFALVGLELTIILPPHQPPEFEIMGMHHEDWWEMLLF